MGTMEQIETPADEKVPFRRWLGVWALALGTFSMVTVEQLPVGVLPAVSGSLHVSKGTAGLMVTVPAIVAAAAALLLPIAIGRLDRRVVMLGLMALMVVASLVSATAPDFAVLLLARFLVGVGIGGFWAMAASLAARMVPGSRIPQAMAVTFGGATAAQVLGVPATTLIGDLAGWRTAFLAAAALGVVVVAGLTMLLPSMSATEPVRLRALPVQFRNRAVRAGVLATFAVVAGHYGAFTFVSPVLRNISGTGKDLVGPLLLGFGVAGILGNFLAGAAAGRDLRRTIMVIGFALAGVLALFPVLGGTVATGVVMLMLWGLAFGGMPVSMQTWVMRSAGPEATEAASALNNSVYNFAIAFGALMGGVVADQVSVSGVLWVGGALALLTTVVMVRAPKP
jgi:predicted MFS family arabinose efflux permease